MTVASTSEFSMIGHNRPPIPDLLSEQHQEIIAKIQPLADRANAMPQVAESDDDLGPIGDLVIDARELYKSLELTRKSESDPHYQTWKEINAFFKPLVERVNRIADTFEGVANKYQREKAAAARRAADEEARKLREAEEKKRQEAEAAKRQATVDRKLDEAEDLADQRWEAEQKAKSSNADLVRVRTDTGVTASVKTRWDFEIVDFKAIPLDDLRYDIKREEIEKAIRKRVATQGGDTSIPGVRVFEDVKSTFRR